MKISSRKILNYYSDDSSRWQTNGSSDPKLHSIFSLFLIPILLGPEAQLPLGHETLKTPPVQIKLTKSF